MKIQALKPYNAMWMALPFLSACQLGLQPLPGPVEYGRSPRAASVSIGNEGRTPSSTEITKLPGAERRPIPGETRPAVQPQAEADLEPVSIAIEQTPLPMFVQILYGSILKKAYMLDPAVQSRTDPVTFKTSQPISRPRMLQLAESLLRNYGLSVQDFDGLVRIAPAGSAAVTTVPMLRTTGDAASPAENRPVYQYVELSVVRVADMSQWLRQMLGSRVTLQEDANRNAFLLSGNPNDMRSAVELIQALDQPRMRGRSARRISPAHATAQDFTTRLADVLTAQGYSVGINSASAATAIMLLPVPSIGSVLVFANGEQTMEHVLRWSVELDRPAVGSSSNNALFTYPVQFADAQELARTLGELLGGAGATSAAPVPASGSGTPSPAATRSFGGRVVVSNATNTLIFRGSSPEEQKQIQQLLKELDRPTKSAMIEVVVAELAVGALQRLGVQWTYSNQGNIGDARRATIGGTGFSLSYANSARQILGAIDALASDSQARILSNPKVLARNGETATIQVGSEVPIVTSQQSTISSSTGSGQTGILQQIQYRSTGVILKVRPVINSGNRLDLDVSQEVSSAATTETGVSATPTISTRKIDTKLSLRDGSTVLLGGLISRDTNTSKAGVPFLKDIPGIGAAFRSQNEASNQKELLVMITPYVINDDYEAEEITAAIQRSFGDWAQEIKTSRMAKPGDGALQPQANPPVPASSAPDRRDETADRTSDPGAHTPARATGSPGIQPMSTPKEAPSRPIEDGVTISRPESKPAMPAPAKPQSEAPPKDGGKPPAASGSPATNKPSGTAPGSAGPADGKPVTDKALLQEFEQHLKRK